LGEDKAQNQQDVREQEFIEIRNKENSINEELPT
jgi:hypothetical protein